MMGKELKDLQTDVKLLLECLDYQKNDGNAVKQALVTLSTILQDSVEAKDEFQESGGLEQVLSLITTSKQHEVVEAGLYCLGSAVEKNVYSQKLLSNASVFTFLHGILSTRRGMFVRKKQTAAYLILCLVTNNGFGQNLARQSSCLQDILNLVRSAFPRNGRMDLNFFDSNEESMYDLWTSLLSAACACINNPMNEENQRQCSSMLPYLFNLFTSQSESKVIRPILSFIGHTVASHSCNQDRVRKCGGIEILVRKLKSLQKHIDTDLDAKLTIVQLLFTLDACISENELSSKRFGELDGINMVIMMLNNGCLDVSDRTQIILTLAHAVDAYGGNDEYIKEGHGVTVLIQQLTTTDDEELNKIVKYLLHMCVSKDDNVDAACIQDNTTFVSHLETMKRLGDMQMLEKISELDNKLKSLENKNSLCDSFGDIRGSKQLPNTDRLSHSGLMDDTSTINSSMSYVQDQSQTPREKSLLEQLIKEKVEKERLEKLNQGLQETLIRNQAEGVQKKTYLNTSDRTTMHGSKNNVSLRTRDNETRNMGSNMTRHVQELENAKHFSMEPIQTYYCDSMCGENNSAKHDRNLSSGKTDIYDNSQKQNDDYSSKFNTSYGNVSQNCVNSVSRDSLMSYNKTTDSLTNMESYKTIAPSTNTESYKTNDFNRYLDSNTSHGQAVLYSAIPLDLSNHTEKLKKPNQKLQNDSNYGHVSSNSIVNKANTSTSSCNFNLKKPTKINRNAEIQCGTPFVLVSDQQSKIDSGIEASTTMSDCSAQTDFVSKPNIKVATYCNEEVKNECNKLVTSEKTTKSTGIGIHNVSRKGPWVCLDREEKVLDVVKKSKAFQNNSSHSISNHNTSSPKSKTSDCFFVRPLARAPKGKVRVTPLLGSNSEHGHLSSQSSVKSMKSSAMSQDSDMLSEFDLDLVKTVQKKPRLYAGIKKPHEAPIGVVKSQNNVRRIDRYVEQQKGNAADTWQVHPTTPSRKTIQPVRPAFSDCGTRRFGFTTSSAIKSPRNATRRRSIDDSGIHSPLNGLTMMSWGSPIDSDIDGFRSSSDVSDEENVKPNINSHVLRSSKKKPSKTDACPGCKGPYVGELELNSRTYNIILETDSNTCSLHRQIRQVERNYIHKQRMVMKSYPKDRLINDKRFLSKKNSKSKQEEDKFAFTSESDLEISPVSDEDMNTALSTCKSGKPRRQRIPYTLEEEANIMEGVEKLGKYWNQILVTYKFHPTRTNVDLMWKYKRMRAASNQGNASTCKSVKTRTHKPFSMCEERRLRRGISKFGYNWKTILKSFTFSDGRTTEDLRNKWRSIHGKK